MSDTTMMQVINPRTGSVCATVSACSAAKTLAAIQDARAAQAAWAARPVVERAKILMRIHDAVLQHRDELLDIIQLETGKNRASALDEVMDVAINARYYARHAARLLRPRRVRGITGDDPHNCGSGTTRSCGHYCPMELSVDPHTI